MLDKAKQTDISGTRPRNSAPYIKTLAQMSHITVEVKPLNLRRINWDNMLAGARRDVHNFEGRRYVGMTHYCGAVKREVK